MGCIYLLYDDEGRCYVGKTNNIENRFKIHKCKSNLTRSRFLNEDFKCEVIVECDDEDELAKLEQTYFDYYKDSYGDKCVNSKRPLQTKKEYCEKYYEKNKERCKEYDKQWREKNKEVIAEYKKQKITCECGSIIRYNEKSRHAKTIKHQNYIKHLLT